MVMLVAMLFGAYPFPEGLERHKKKRNEDCHYQKSSKKELFSLAKIDGCTTFWHDYLDEEKKDHLGS